MYCNNCGNFGHKYNMCRYPIMSFGILLYYKDQTTSKLLMIQRKHSICYIEFLRGKYITNSDDYIIGLFRRMTDHEKDKLLSESFLELWQSLWIDVDNIKQKFKDEYIKSEKKYLFLKKQGKIKELYDKTKGSFSETEWEFPKGRRNEHEKNIECAIREIEEETGLIVDQNFMIYNNIYPLVDAYQSFNKVNYKHVYYIARILNKEITDSIKVDQNNIHQMKEINNLLFLTKGECIEKIRDYNHNKIKLIEQLFNFTDAFEDNFTEIKI